MTQPVPSGTSVENYLLLVIFMYTVQAIQFLGSLDVFSFMILFIVVLYK